MRQYSIDARNIKNPIYPCPIQMGGKMQMVKCYPSEITIFLWMENLSSGFAEKPIFQG